MRIALTACLLLLAPNLATGQLIRLKLQNERIEKRHKAHLLDYQGGKVLVGEVKSGLELKDGRWVKAKAIQMWVPDPADPLKLPYKFDREDKKVANGKKTVVNLAETDVVDIQYYMQNSSFLALSREYEQRMDQIDKLRAARDEHEKSSRRWFYAHRMMVNAQERLHTWLKGTVYPAASKKLEKSIAKEKKAISKEAYEERARLALDSMKVVENERLPAVVSEICGDKYRFKVQDSQHLRITYFQKYPDEVIGDLLKLGETMIDGFRAHNIDPYLDEDYVDAIPDGLFLEFYFGPNDLDVHEHMLEKYYEIQWGDHRQERIRAASGRYRRLTVPQYLQYWNIEEHPDMDGIVAHGLGHTLTSIHYNENRKEDAPPWLEEGVAFYLSLEYLGQNSVMCKEFTRDTYGQSAGPEGEKTIEMGERELFNEIARTRGPNIDALLIKTLHQMDDADFAKAWSLYDYLVFREGKNGQLWLRTVAEASRQGLSANKVREPSNELFGVTDGDVFRVLNERWAEYAAKFQPVGDKKKRRR